MAVWRDRRIETIVGGTIDADHLTEEALRRLVDEVPVETETVEYKDAGALHAFPDKSPNGLQWTRAHERAKDVSAFANARGGILIYGIVDHKKEPDTAARMKPVIAADADDAVESYRRELRQTISPLVDCDVFPVRADSGGFYVVVVVSPDSSGPHGVHWGPKDKQGLIHFTRALGDSHIRLLTEHEVAGRYQARFRSGEERRRRIDSVWSTGLDGLERKGRGGLWLVACVVPDDPYDVPFTTDEQHALIDWSDRSGFPDGMLGAITNFGDYPFPAPGFMEFTQKPDANGDTVGYGTYRALHVDGSGFAGIELPRKNADGPTFDIDHDELLDAVTAAIPHLLAWAEHRVGRWGLGTAHLTLHAPNVEAVHRVQRPKSPTQGTGFVRGARLSPGGSGTHGGRRVETADRHTLVADFAATATMTNALQVAYGLALSVVQMFGQMEPSLLTSEGKIRNVMMDGKFDRHASEWAHRHGVKGDEGWAADIRIRPARTH